MEMRLDEPQIAVFIDFENVATSAEANYGDFDVTAVADLLRARGRLLIKRAYGDWGRFHRYRRPMLENGIDLLQLYSVGIQQKNRADVRLAIDAMEAVFTRPNINVYAIVSGDSDFTELVHKLRDYGKYTIGIGLHSATSDLLRRACDEFIFYETLIDEGLDEIEDDLQEIDSKVYVKLPKSHDGPVPLVPLPEGLAPPTSKPAGSSDIDPGQRYRSFLREAGLRVVEPAARRQVLADFLDAVRSSPAPISLNAAADLLKDRYDAENAFAQKMAVAEVMRLLVMSDGLRYQGGQSSSDAPLLDPLELDVDTLAAACDCVYVGRLIQGGVRIDAHVLAPVLYGASADAQQVITLCERLAAAGLIGSVDGGCTLAPAVIDRLLAREGLALPAAALARVELPPGEPSIAAAESLFREASDLRQKDFAGSAQRYLQATAIQLNALRAGQPRAGYDDLKWYLASYCSVKAGHAFVSGNYGEAVPFYLAFFGLAREADCVWPRIQRLVNPMTSYYFAIGGKRLNESVPQNLGRSPAVQVALRIHNHPNPLVGQAWEDLIRRLAGVNLGILRVTYREMTGLAGLCEAGEPARVERTRAFLADVIGHCQEPSRAAPLKPLGLIDAQTPDLD